MKPRRVNVDRMHRYRDRSRGRFVWTREERQALLDAMEHSLDRMRAEDEHPYGYFPGPRMPDMDFGGTLSHEDLDAIERAPRAKFFPPLVP